MKIARITVAYDGTNFEGWQVQAEGKATVQGKLQESLERITGKRIIVHGSGRTDSGVHATGQVASFRVPENIPLDKLVLSLNSVLPKTIRIRDIAKADEGFHAQYCCKGKRYVYLVANKTETLPFLRRYCWYVKRPLDVSAMKLAARAIVGEHDFSSFKVAGSNVKTSVRKIEHLKIIEGSGEFSMFSRDDERIIRFEIEGSGFLKQMVRSIVGTLVEIGKGRRDAGDMPGIIAAKSRKAAGITAPAHGLFLDKVFY